jgi:L-arabinokinase
MERGVVPVGYLANIPPPLFERECLPWLPEAMSGAEFLERYTGTGDTVTTVDPERVYRIRQPAAHPVYEHARAREFRQRLQEPASEARRVRLGELMYASHASYSACGLGTPGTDRIVDLVRGEGAVAGLYGARITGGGSGGTVAVLGRRDAAGAIQRVVDRYGEAAGQRPYLFSGSSPGVAAFGVRSVRL